LQLTKKRLNLKRVSEQRSVNPGYRKEFSNGMKKIQDRQRKLTILTLSMTLSFYMTWGPYAVHSILKLVPGEYWQPSYISNVIAILCAKSGTIINPILYIFFNDDVSKWLAIAGIK
jgi:hypothetical protein